MASTQITWNNGTTGNRQIWTWSFWVKRSKLGTEQCVWTTRYNGSNNHLFRFNANDTFTFKGANSASGTIMDLTSNEAYRDTSGWYHFVLAVDSTQSTAADRAKVYVNGTQITSFATADYGAQNQSYEINEANNQVFWIGSENSQNYFDGCLSHVWFIDGTQYAASTFGETDSTTGEWKIKTDVSATMGTNGFQVLKDGSGITDTSSNSNNFSSGGGTLTNTEDCPSNVFATVNSLDGVSDSAPFANGNTTWSTSSTSHFFWGRSTIGASSGKYYFEAKLSSASSYNHIGICDRAAEDATTTLESETYGWGYKNSDGQVYNNGSGTSYGNTFTTGDILGVAMDLDNNRLFFHKNGTYQNSGDPTSSTGAITITAPASTSTGNYFFVVSDNSSGDNVTWQCNFGNGTFGSTAVSSAGTNASGNGVFEYDVPTGYTALCTKGINS